MSVPVDDLALEVRRLDPVKITDHQMPGARCGQVHRSRRAEPTHADDENSGIEQALLTGLGDLAQADLAAVADPFGFVHAMAAGAPCGAHEERRPGIVAQITGDPYPRLNGTAPDNASTSPSASSRVVSIPDPKPKPHITLRPL